MENFLHVVDFRNAKLITKLKMISQFIYESESIVKKRMIDINNLKKILCNSNLVTIKLIDKEGLKNSYDPFDEDDQKILHTLLKKFETPLVIKGFKGKLFILEDETVIYQELLKYFEIIEIFDTSKGVYGEELEMIRKHILKSSYFCRFIIIFDFLDSWKFFISFAIIALIMFLKIIGTSLFLAYSLAIPIFIFIIIIYIYIFQYQDKVVNDMTFDMLSTHEPTIKYIFSGDFEGKGKEDLTNIILYMIYKHIKIKEKEIKSSEFN